MPVRSVGPGQNHPEPLRPPGHPTLNSQVQIPPSIPSASGRRSASGRPWACRAVLKARYASPGRSRNSRRSRATSGPPDHWSGPDAVRYMSVHSWKQPDLHGHSGTSPGPDKRPVTGRNPSSRAVFAGGGRWWIRTTEGVADGFTARSRTRGSVTASASALSALSVIRSCSSSTSLLQVELVLRVSRPGNLRARAALA